MDVERTELTLGLDWCSVCQRIKPNATCCLWKAICTM